MQYGHENKPHISDVSPVDVTALLHRLNALEYENRKLKTETERFRIITEYMNDALFIINIDGTYDYFNKQAKKYAANPENIKKVGDSFQKTKYFDMSGQELSIEEYPSSRVLRGETLDNVRLRVEWPGFLGWFSYSGCPIYNEDGTLTSAIVCFRDVTKICEYEQQIHEQKRQLETIVKNLQEQKELLEATVKKLLQSEMQLKMASEGAKAGIYAYDFETGKGIWSDMFNKIHGLKNNDVIPLDEDRMFTGLHPEDRQRFLQAMKDAHDTGGNGIADIEYRINLPDGTLRWLHLRGQTHFTGEGENRRPYMTGGAVMDVTDRVIAEQNVRKLSVELRKIIDSTDDLIWSLDRDFRLLYFNASFKSEVEKAFGITVEEGLILKDVFPAEAHVWTEFYERAVTDGKFQIDLTSQLNDRMYSYYFYPVYVNSEIVGITCFAKDLTERMKTEKRLVSENAELELTVRERTDELRQLGKGVG
jgi:PAS domain S-box-containing protein